MKYDYELQVEDQYDDLDYLEFQEAIRKEMIYDMETAYYLNSADEQ